MDTRRPVVEAAEEVLDAYFPVLDHGFVALKDYMGGDAAIEQAARVSFGEGTRRISDRQTLLRYLFRKKHSTPFECTELNLHLGLPIVAMRQLIRHRTANVSEYSGRYSIMPLLFYTPEADQVCRQSASNRQGRSELVDIRDFSDWRVDQEQTRLSARRQYKHALEMGIARETARLDLPLSTYTFCYWKIDLRNMFNVLSLRCDQHAQWEIRQFADVMAGIVQRLAPLSFEAWQDYQENAMTFSQAEIRAIRLLSDLGCPSSTWDSPTASVRGEAEEAMSDAGSTKREIGEFWDKLRVRTKRDYSLDPMAARDGEHYRKLIAAHAVEIPEGG